MAVIKNGMDYKTFRSHLGRAGLTNKDFAELVKINSKSITNFAKMLVRV